MDLDELRSMLRNRERTRPLAARYEWLEPLGEGGFGSVFLGREVATNRRVAVKILPLEAESPERESSDPTDARDSTEIAGDGEKTGNRPGTPAPSTRPAEQEGAVHATATVAEVTEALDDFDEAPSVEGGREPTAREIDPSKDSVSRGRPEASPARSEPPSPEPTVEEAAEGEMSTGGPISESLTSSFGESTGERRDSEVSDPESDRNEPGPSTDSTGDSAGSRTEIIEAETLSRLSHPAVVEFYEIAVTDDFLVLVMEYVEGETLSRVVREGVWAAEPERALEAMLEVADALKAVHARGVHHLDLKPANLMRDANGDLRVLDFGTSGVVETNLDEGFIQATPKYMSPEHTGVTDWDPGPWSDLYSLGTILYAALSGRVPFEGVSTIDTIRRHLRDRPRPLSEFNPNISPFVEDIVMTLLEKSPSERYQTAAGLEHDLERALETGTSFTHQVRIWDRFETTLRDDPKESTSVSLPGRDGEIDEAVAAVVSNTNPVTVVESDAKGGLTAFLEALGSELESEHDGVAVRARAAEEPQDLPGIKRLCREVLSFAKGAQTTAPDRFARWSEHVTEIRPVVEHLRSQLPGVGALLPGEPSPSEAQPEEELELWSRLFRHLLRGPDPVFALIDDSHWLSPRERRLLGSSFGSETSNLEASLVLGIHPGLRPKADGWHRDLESQGANRIELSALGEESLESWFRRATSTSADLSAVCSEAISVSGGRPGYVQQFVKYLVDEGRVRTRGRSLQFVTSDGERTTDFAPPIDRERLRTLDDDLRGLLEQIALLGGKAHRDVVAAIHQGPLPSQEQLASLERRGLLERQGAVIRLPHREVQLILGSVLDPEEGMRARREAFESLRRAYQSSLNSSAANRSACHRLADLANDLEDFDRALTWLVRGGVLELETDEPHRALSRLRRAAYYGAEDEEPVRYEGATLLEYVGDAARAVGSHSLALEQYRSALEHAESERERRRLHLRIATVEQLRQQFTDSVESLRTHLDFYDIEVPEQEGRVKRGLLGKLLVFFFLRLLHHTKLLPLVQSNLDEDEREHQRELFESLSTLTVVAEKRGQTPLMMWAHLSLMNRGLRIGEPEFLADPYATHGTVLTLAPKRFPETGVQYVNRAMEYAEESGDHRSLKVAGTYGMLVALWTGDYENAFERGERYTPFLVQHRDFYEYQMVFMGMTYLDIYTGHLGPAKRRVLQFMAHAHEFGTFEVVHVTDYFLAYISFVRGYYSKAAGYLEEAREANEEAGDEAFRAALDWVEFKLLLRNERPREAVELAVDSVDRISDMYIDHRTETLCRAIEVACRASEIGADVEDLVDRDMLGDWVDEALERTEQRPQFRPMALTEQARVAWLFDEREPDDVLELLDEATSRGQKLHLWPFVGRAKRLKARIESELGRKYSAAMSYRDAAAYFWGSGWIGYYRTVEKRLERLIAVHPALEKYKDALEKLHTDGDSPVDPNLEIDFSDSYFSTAVPQRRGRLVGARE